MCLAIPGKVLEINGINALVDFDGVKRNVVIGLTPSVKEGDYVVVHAGYAIQIVDEEEAKNSIAIWQQAVEELNLDKEDII
ncbi:MAG: HypC/HybG/HupF family hydrogenase formation chaperone [Promethearchaeota archaeon]